MFSFFKRDPLKVAQGRLTRKLEEARDAQRNGNMALFAELSAEAESIGAEVDRLAAQKRS